MAYIVYQLRLENEEMPFYVGMGSESRPFEHLTGKDGKNKHKNNKILKANSDGVLVLVEVLYRDLDRGEACQREVELIALMGRRDLGTGSLTNLTSGGEGLVSPSEDTRRKIREARLKQGHSLTEASIRASLGSKRSDNARSKMRDAKLGTTRSEEAKRKTTDSLLKYNRDNPAEFTVCPHCGTKGKESGMKSWHFEYCKLNPNRKERGILCVQ